MPAERRYGMDHPHYPWSPMIKRGRLEWPEQARVALCVIVSLEHTEWLPPEDSVQAAPHAAGMIRRPYPDYSRLTHREYGHRVGIFRILEVLEKHGITPTIAIDALTAEHYPYLVQHCRQRGCEFMAHGVAATRMINNDMSVQDEQDYIQTTLDTLAQATGERPSGWLGPEYGESSRTPQLLAQAGVRYVCDWVNDEQPYRMTTPEGELYALPMMLELDDVHALWERRVRTPRYGQLLQEGFGRLYTDGADRGRLLVIHLHPWLMGQPFRIRYLDEALQTMMRRQGVWAACGREIIDWYRGQSSE
ncbi:polysaccharide deacetylase family protein [Candidatus Entotheonella palauensis]|uniref:polysaccharide deacetylase family protein n=1 Tax=Candidatus Entotheonella palauensis TaxID=93172 RepID=UPI000B7C64D0|nr:polysaccharide deacetylase family protein [Candidatus Entotheonella palauensis]